MSDNSNKFINKNLEKSILSSIFFEPDIFTDILHMCQEDDFSDLLYKKIFKAMLTCYQNSQPISEIFIKKYLDKNYDEEINEICAVSTISDIEYYVAELHELGVKRRLINFSQKIPPILQSNIDSKEAVEKISSDFYLLVDGGANGKMVHIRDAATQYLKYLQEQKSKNNKLLSGLNTGFDKLNFLTKGFKPGELIIIAARPGMGKTALALNFALSAINEDKGVVFYSLEMPSSQLVMRLTSNKASIELNKLVNGSLEDSDYDRMVDCINDLNTKNMFIYDSGDLTIHKIKTQMRRLKKQHNINLCIIDYIGLMTSSGTFSERHLQVGEISRGLKLLARELEIPIIALAQLNRSLESRTNKRPILSDLRESGSIEQDADVIMFVYRQSQYEESDELNKNKDDAEIIIGKNRNGPTGEAHVIFAKQFCRFIQSDDSEYEEALLKVKRG